MWLEDYWENLECQLEGLAFAVLPLLPLVWLGAHLDAGLIIR